MSPRLLCWKCGASLQRVTLPFGHMDLCPLCREELHVCRMCRSYDPAISGKCRKEEADYVANKERANYCHYFQPSGHAFKGSHKSKQQQSRNELDALFGKSSEAEQPSADYEAIARKSKSDLDAMFGDSTEKSQETLSPEEKARRELEALFGKKPE